MRLGVNRRKGKFETFLSDIILHFADVLYILYFSSQEQHCAYNCTRTIEGVISSPISIDNPIENDNSTAKQLKGSFH